ncbi:hypothetical protein, partial [Candidatus Amarobacter glycogenicus]|uniref:hypothetical protein n=1 Tax=Candidatus Amarobacter glycogenicus TaxID=3140699 RepID=UPI0031CC9700
LLLLVAEKGDLEIEAQIVTYGGLLRRARCGLRRALGKPQDSAAGGSKRPRFSNRTWLTATWA